MASRSRRPQPLLPGVAPAQSRLRGRESGELHAAVVALRRNGNRVYRAGRGTSLVNGVRVPDAAIARIGERRN